MYSLGTIQRNHLPLETAIPLQLSGYVSVQAYRQNLVEKAAHFHNTYSFYLLQDDD